MAEVTIMLLKVDLQCSKCYKKVKKVLCKFPEIRDQVYDEKQNTVTIKVVTCCPDRLMQKICCKGGKAVKSIEIKPPAKPKEPEKKKEPEKEKPKEPEKKKEPEKEKPKEPEKKKEAEKPEDPKPTKPKVVIVDPPPKQKPQPPKASDPAPTPKAIVPATTPNAPVPEPGYPPGYPNYPFGACCRECNGGHGVGPCQQLGYGRPIYYDGYYGRPVYDSWGGGGGDWSRGNCRSRGDYFCEENPSTCSIM
ncbi:protein PYRICULARIA ORYZAE RESISTANCE 21-like [Pistacia vera]|uniref:protein PYRICULARIA ORYZAE RESISTANCE 21-like n=1 Tax=Pistacia vera TaxID=55513 RepID=UPI001262F2E6|nr:protein PYRICULARIA ORYZAE RESISTANCE 21-like [Pistacia vera]